MAAARGDLPRSGRDFAVTRRGYAPGEVEEDLRELDARIQALTSDRDTAVEQNRYLSYQTNVAWAEIDRLRVQVRRLSAAPHGVEALSERLAALFDLAQEEMAEQRERAEAEAEAVVARSRADAAARRERVEAAERQLESDRADMAAEGERVLAAAGAEAEQLRDAADAGRARVVAEAAADAELLVREARERCRELDSAAAARRERETEDFTAAMSLRRTEAIAAVEQTQTAAQADADDLVARAGARATAVVDEARAEAARLLSVADQAGRDLIAAADQRVADLEAVYMQVMTQLAGVRGLLDHACPGSAATSGDDRAEDDPADPDAARRRVGPPTGPCTRRDRDGSEPLSHPGLTPATGLIGGAPDPGVRSCP
jgi:hypothetical protein